MLLLLRIFDSEGESQSIRCGPHTGTLNSNGISVMAAITRVMQVSRAYPSAYGFRSVECIRIYHSTFRHRHDGEKVIVSCPSPNPGWSGFHRGALQIKDRDPIGSYSKATAPPCSPSVKTP